MVKTSAYLIFKGLKTFFLVGEIHARNIKDANKIRLVNAYVFMSFFTTGLSIITWPFHKSPYLAMCVSTGTLIACLILYFLHFKGLIVSARYFFISVFNSLLICVLIIFPQNAYFYLDLITHIIWPFFLFERVQILSTWFFVLLMVGFSIYFFKSDPNTWGIIHLESQNLTATQVSALVTSFANLIVPVVLNRHLTEKYQNDLMVNQAQLAHAERLITIGELSANLSHEINSPLSTIAYAAANISKKAKDQKLDPIFREYLENSLMKINKITDQIARTIKGLKQLSASGATHEMEIISINNVLHDCLDFCEERCQTYSIKFERPTLPDCNIKCMSVQVAQVFLNLIANSVYALKSIDERWIRIEAEVLKETNRVKISVTDSGKGIPAHLHQHIFDNFFTTKPKGQGTGLGLSISNKIIKDHEGKIYIDSQCPNTRFVVELPLHV